jgi:tetratricopeptide (TPR) repeat protein
MVIPRGNATGTAGAMSFSPNGMILAIAYSSRVLRLVELPSGRELATLAPSQPGAMEWLRFSPDGSRLAAAGSNGLQVWDLRLIGRELAEIGLDEGFPSYPPAGHTRATESLRVELPPVQPTSSAADSLMRVDALIRRGRYQEAVSAADAAIKADPRAKALYLILSDAHYRLGHYQQAADAARRHLDLCADCGQALFRLANCRAAEGAHEEAIQLLERAVQVNPSQPWLCNNLAWLYVTGPERVRNAEKALSLAQRAVAVTPDNEAYQHTLSVVYYRLGKFDQAVDILQAVTKPATSKRMEALTQLFLAMSYHRLGDAAKAKECFARAPRLTSDDRLPSHLTKEVESIRAEAAALLGIVERP